MRGRTGRHNVRNGSLAEGEAFCDASGLAPTADITRLSRHVRLVPIADMLGARGGRPDIRLAGRWDHGLSGLTWNESISPEPLPKAVGTEIR
jgi:hypothetical protein